MTKLILTMKLYWLLQMTSQLIDLKQIKLSIGNQLTVRDQDSRIIINGTKMLTTKEDRTTELSYPKELLLVNLINSKTTSSKTTL